MILTCDDEHGGGHLLIFEEKFDRILENEGGSSLFHCNNLIIVDNALE